MSGIVLVVLDGNNFDQHKNNDGIEIARGGASQRGFEPGSNCDNENEKGTHHP